MEPMSESIEIEFKNMLSKDEYELLFQEFKINNEEIFSQENHYFDTPDFALKELGSALRIRQKKGKYELTLKQPSDVGLLETTQILLGDEYKAALEKGALPNGPVSDRLKVKEIQIGNIKYFGSLTTNRVEFSYKNGLLVLDHSIYLNKEDYELEYEVNDYHVGYQVFQELLQKYDIPLRKTENKIRRFYNQKYFLNSKN